VVETIADGVSFQSTSRYGTMGPHYDVPLELLAAVSPAAKMLSSVETPPTSINAQRHKAPTPWHYTPTTLGQFARVLTVDDLEDRRRHRLDAARRTQAGSVVSDKKPDEVQHLALGPGTYDVDKDVRTSLSGRIWMGILSLWVLCLISGIWSQSPSRFRLARSLAVAFSTVRWASKISTQTRVASTSTPSGSACVHAHLIPL
jgi:hypothetical protein